MGNRNSVVPLSSTSCKSCSSSSTLSQASSTCDKTTANPPSSTKLLSVIDMSKCKIPIRCSPPHDDYQKCRKVGCGAFATVYQIRPKANPNRVLALKEMDMLNLSPKQLKYLIREVNILSQLDHPNIVQLHEVHMDDDMISLIEDYIEGEELMKYVKIYDESSAREVFTSLVEAVEYIHSKGVIHRDIKPNNIIVDSSYSHTTLIDFGLATTVNDPETLNSKYLIGTEGYIAPEAYRKASYYTASDIWSLGVVLYEMLTGKHPFPKDDRHMIANGIYEMPNVSPSAANLIQRMLTVDPDMRITASEILQHPWILNDTEMNSYFQPLNRIKPWKKITSRQQRHIVM